VPGGDEDLRVGRLCIPAGELEVDAVRSGGPGGQNVNKVASQIQLRFSVRTSRSLSDAERALLERRLAHRLTKAGELLVRSSRYRERSRNLADARARLADLLGAALAPRRVRRPTKPTRGAKESRLRAKRRRAEHKRARRGPSEGE
jgi:ribosome-associated protein